MIKLAETRNDINVVSDQIGAPTYTKDLAEFIVSLVLTNKYGTYHGVNEGYCSWYEFAKVIFEKTESSININPISSKEYPTKAKRPLNSKLGKANSDVANIKRLPDWKDALSRYLATLNE
jgi:dTDP-4-dehydrorhamnose reductase/dTDP-4-dehydrorhamnose 3,5-epimerase